MDILHGGYDGYNRTGELPLEWFDPEGVWGGSDAILRRGILLDKLEVTGSSPVAPTV